MLRTKIISKITKAVNLMQCFSPFRIKFINRHLENRYYSKVIKKLFDPSTSLKMYWSILITFSNNKKHPLLFRVFHENEIIDFKQRTEIFNNVHL